MSSLRDAYGRRHTYLRLSITDRCNLRCSYCVPREGYLKERRSALLSFRELVRVVRILAALGIRKVRITGGEPLIRRGVVGLVQQLAGLRGGPELVMTTNGLLLGSFAGALREAGLRRINVSIDTLKPERFRAITGRDGIGQVLEGIEAAFRAGFSPLKLNVVAMRGVNDDELEDFVRLLYRWPVEVRFIEFMPFTSRSWPDTRFIPASELRQRIAASFALQRIEEHPAGSVAKRFRLRGTEGVVGFIAPLSEHFCLSCNRLRIMANGGLKTCLFSPPLLNLRLLLRSGEGDDHIAAAIKQALAEKALIHPRPEKLLGGGAVSMTEIGG